MTTCTTTDTPPPYLVLRDGAVAALDNVLLDVVQVNGGGQLAPLPAVRGSALHPHWQVLVNQEGLGAGGYLVPSLLFPHVAPLLEDSMTRLGTTREIQCKVGVVMVGGTTSHFL